MRCFVICGSWSSRSLFFVQDEVPFGALNRLAAATRDIPASRNETLFITNGFRDSVVSVGRLTKTAAVLSGLSFCLSVGIRLVFGKEHVAGTVTQNS